ncbi:MAG: phosphoribosylanthranilate isomerase [Firmicutes bacterium]|nr:phosphoribosylanthranilate isomerase [Bacillota bacterium]
MEIKVCGIRRKEDVEIVNEYKPDYIGFVFAKSRRRVSAEEAAKLSAALADGIKTVGVFVNENPREVERIAKTAGLYAVQLHGDEDEDYISRLNVNTEIWKAVRVRGGDIVTDVKGADRILLDKYSEAEYGGGGKPFDWLGGLDIRAKAPIMLAGGLNARNVADGIRIFAPAGVDVSSGVETDEYKDRDKIKEFIEKVRGEGTV